MRVVVTGGAGFIGSHIVDTLHSRGLEVIVIDNLSSGGRYRPRAGVTFYKEDILSSSLYTILGDVKPDRVIHQAAQVQVARSVSDPLEDAQINVIGTLNLLEACRKLRIGKLIFASSAAVYGDPLTLPIPEEHPIQPRSPYALSKYTAERYLSLYHELYGLDYTILRYGNVYGPRQRVLGGDGGVVASFVKGILAGERVRIYGDGHQNRDFVYVTDVAEANVVALEKGSASTFNIGSSRTTTLWELVACISEHLKQPVRYEHLPPRHGDVRSSLLQIEKARTQLGWEPAVSLEQGIGRTLAYALEEGLE